MFGVELSNTSKNENSLSPVREYNINALCDYTRLSNILWLGADIHADHIFSQNKYECTSSQLHYRNMEVPKFTFYWVLLLCDFNKDVEAIHKRVKFEIHASYFLRIFTISRIINVYCLSGAGNAPIDFEWKSDKAYRQTTLYQ